MKGRTVTAALAAAALAALPAAAAPPANPGRPVAGGLNGPSAVAVTADGTVYVTLTGEPGKPGVGSIVRVDPDGTVTTVVNGLDDPVGVAASSQWLFVTDRTELRWANGKGQHGSAAPRAAYPAAPVDLRGAAVCPGNELVYFVDAGGPGAAGAVYQLGPNSKVDLVADAKKVPGLRSPTALVMDGASAVVVGDAATGTLYRVRLADGAGEKIAEGLGAVSGLAWDGHGRLYVTDRAAGTLTAIPRPWAKPVVVAGGLKAPAGVTFDPPRNRLLVPCGSGDVVAFAPAVPGFEVDETPAAVRTEPAFPGLAWTGWEPETADGKVNQHRPVVLTHSGDGSRRAFVATQQGVVHVVPPGPGPAATKVFLDLRDKVRYQEDQNEEGFLGLAFHPRYKQTGEFYAFYTPKAERAVNVVSRFRVSKADPDRADPASEEVVYRFENRPFWAHDGGTVCFGPDGCLYVTHGDGGSIGDPFEHAQNLASPLGTILRLDVDRRDPGKAYAVPPDNPFAGRPGARPEIWAFGFRNVWRMSFDRATGRLWAADVGQDLFEEINLVQKGGNYGWNRREGLHPHGPRGSGPAGDLVDPIWEYSHQVGRSVVGGAVYRGAKLPELAGHYVYADYVSNKMWALKYDETAGRVVANRPIPDRGRPVFSFGEDEDGELYVLTGSSDGKGVFVLTK